MAKLDYSKSSGAKLLNDVSKKNKEQANGQIIRNIAISDIVRNELNAEIFNMDKIDALATSIKRDGFIGGIEVFERGDGKYDLSAGHRRLMAVESLGWSEIPAIILKPADNVAKARNFILSNINSREMTALDIYRAINYYKANVVDVMVQNGEIAKDDAMNTLATDLGMTNVQMERYLSIGSLIPELQELCAHKELPYTAIILAGDLTKKEQTLFNRRFRSYLKPSDNNPNEFELSLRVADIRQMVSACKIETKKIKKATPKDKRNTSTTNIDSGMVNYYDNGVESIGSLPRNDIPEEDIAAAVIEPLPAVKTTINIDDFIETTARAFLRFAETDTTAANKKTVLRNISQIENCIEILKRRVL